MKNCALLLLLLASVACLASHAEKPNQKEYNDSPSIILENTLGRQLSSDANDEEDRESANNDASLQNDGLPNQTTDFTRDEEDEECVNEEASQVNDDLPSEENDEENYSQDSAASEELDIQSDSYKNCSRVFRSNSGRFSSPGYPFSYPNNARCRWIIRPRFRAIIRVTFAKFDVDRSSFICRKDYVEVRGDGIRSQRYCGRRKAPLTVMISGYQASIMLRSDRHRTGRGFLARYTVTPRPPFHPLPRPTGPSGDLARFVNQFASRISAESIYVTIMYNLGMQSALLSDRTESHSPDFRQPPC